MTESSEIELSSTRLRGASAFQQLHWLASGRVSAAQLTDTYLSAIDQHNPALNAYPNRLSPRLWRPAPAISAAPRAA